MLFNRRGIPILSPPLNLMMHGAYRVNGSYKACPSSSCKKIYITIPILNCHILNSFSFVNKLSALILATGNKLIKTSIGIYKILPLWYAKPWPKTWLTNLWLLLNMGKGGGSRYNKTIGGKVPHLPFEDLMFLIIYVPV